MSHRQLIALLFFAYPFFALTAAVPDNTDPKRPDAPDALKERKEKDKDKEKDKEKEKDKRNRARLDIFSDDGLRVKDRMSEINAVDRAALLIAQASAEAGDTEKAIATLDTLVTETANDLVRSLGVYLKGVLYLKNDNVPQALDAFVAVSGEFQPQALRAFIKAAGEKSLYADALTKLADAYKTSKVDLDKARMINAVFLLAQRSKDAQPEFQFEAYGWVIQTIGRPEADRLKKIFDVWQESEIKQAESEKAKRDADAAASLPEQLSAIEKRLGRIEDAARAAAPGGDRRNRMDDQPPAMDERAAEMADMMRQRFEERIKEMEVEMKKLQDAGNIDAANEIKKNIDRMRERMERGREMMERGGFGGRGERGRGERGGPDENVRDVDPNAPDGNPPPVKVRGDDF